MKKSSASPRFSGWLKLTLGLAALAALMVVGLWALRRDEPPPDDADLRSYRRGVKEEENGFRLVNLTADEVAWPDDGEEEGLVHGHSEIFDEEKAAELADRNAAVLERVDRCLALPEFQLDLLESMEAEVPYLLGWRKLAYALASRSRLRLERDDPAGAYEDGMRLVRFGRRIQKAQGTLIEYLVGVAVQSIGIHRVLEAAIQGLPLQVLEQGIDTFTRELPTPLEFQDMLRAEYIVMAATFDRAAAGEIVDPEYSIRWLRFFFKPNETKRFLAEEFRILVDSISLPALDRPRRDTSRYEATVPEMIIRARFGKVMLQHMLPAHEDAPAQADLCRFGLSATQALFAILAHKAEKGALPESLDALVPGYLASLPLDPADGKPLRYSAAKHAIYSIGTDGVDSGGSTEEKASDALGDLEEPTLRFDPGDWNPGNHGDDVEPSDIEDEE